MNPLNAHLDWIDTQRDRMVERVCEWASINTHSYNVEGLEACMSRVRADFAPLADSVGQIALPPHRTIDSAGLALHRPLGPLLHCRKRPGASRRVLLGIHLDTVYAPDDPFQQVAFDGDAILHGPGVTDAKGGLAVLRVALEAFERWARAGETGWDVVINPDEEIGSPGSGPIWTALAQHASLGLLFEPALEDGALVSHRKGSGTFVLIMTGRAAHAGRDPHRGRNAIHALCRVVEEVADLAGPGVTVNTGSITGGGAVNVVPHHALARVNVRVESVEDQQRVEHRLAELAEEINTQEGLSLRIEGGFTAPPKPLDAGTRELLDRIAACGKMLGIELTWRASGGVCDGNRLAAAGLPTMDSLGPVGREIHSPRERLMLDSLVPRAKLAALTLMSFVDPSVVSGT